MKIKLTSETDLIDWGSLAMVYRMAPLGDRDPSKLKTVFDNSSLRCFLFDGSRIVGAARAISDGFDCAVICDVAILPDYQNKGLGSMMLDYLMERLSGHNKILLYASPGKEGFYINKGFRNMKTALAFFNDPENAYKNGFID